MRAIKMLDATAKTADSVTPVQVWTLVVAGLAVVATVVAAILLRRTGKGTVAAAEKAAEASARSALAAEKSAQAAQDAVGVNRETAIAVAERAEADALAKRYQDAASQLGHPSPAVRIAGVHAMIDLADRWPEQRQACVDILCSYMRLPPGSPDGTRSLPNDDVAQTILRTIDGRLTSSDPATSWSDLHFNFSGSTFADVVLTGWKFLHPVDFSRCTFVGKCWLRNFEIAGGISFANATVLDDFALVRTAFVEGQYKLPHLIDFRSVTFAQDSTSDIDIPRPAEDAFDIECNVYFYRVQVDGIVKVVLHKHPGDRMGFPVVNGIEIRVGEHGAFAVAASGMWQNDDGSIYASFPIIAPSVAPGGQLLVQKGLTMRGVSISAYPQPGGAIIDTEWKPPEPEEGRLV